MFVQEKEGTKNQQPLEYAVVDTSKKKKKKDDKQEKVCTYIQYIPNWFMKGFQCSILYAQLQ